MKNWKISKKYIFPNHIAIETENGRGKILVERHIKGEDSEDIKIANMICAAPDMLNALILIRESTHQPYETMSQEAHDAMILAIKKAGLK